MFNIIDFLSMSSHEFLLAEDTPDPPKYLSFYQNVKAALRESWHKKTKTAIRFHLRNHITVFIQKYIIFVTKPISGYGDAPHQGNTPDKNMQVIAIW